MRKSYKFIRKQTFIPKYRTNREIKVEELSIIDELGAFLGTMPTAKALALAEERGFDLVEVNPSATPPVAKLLNFSSFRYKQEKLAKKQKTLQKKIETKGIRLSLKISDHDAETRINQARGFFEEGHKVKVELILRGREMQHQDLARQQILDFVTKLDWPHTVEQSVSKQGNKMFTILIPVTK